MSGEIAIKLPLTGLTLKALVLGPDRSKRWNGSAMAAISSVADADWETGMVDLIEQVTSDATATKIYVGDFPTGITTPGDYTAIIFQDASPILPGAAAEGQQSPIPWGGSAEVSVADDIYTAEAKYTRDQGNTSDRYTAQWLKNGIVVLDGSITLPTLTVHKDDDSLLINAKAMTERTAGDLVTYTATEAERLAVGEGARALFQATIGGAVRSWPLVMSRDSS